MTNFSHDYNNIYLGQRQRTFFFRDRGQQVMGQEVFHDLSWGCGWYDFDNDTDIDLFFSNGHVYKEADLFEKTRTSYDQFNALFENLDPATLSYREVGPKGIAQAKAQGRSSDGLDAGPGMDVRRSSRGAAFGDFDNDGRVDVFVQNMNQPATLLRNTSAPALERGWIKLALRQPGANRDALGASLDVHVGEAVLRVPVIRGMSFLGTDDARLHVGLGDARRCDVRVRWPDGAETGFDGLEAGGLWILDRETGRAEAGRLPPVPPR